MGQQLANRCYSVLISCVKHKNCVGIPGLEELVNSKWNGISEAVDAINAARRATSHWLCQQPMTNMLLDDHKWRQIATAACFMAEIPEMQLFLSRASTKLTDGDDSVSLNDRGMARFGVHVSVQTSTVSEQLEDLARRARSTSAWPLSAEEIACRLDTIASSIRQHVQKESN